MQSPSTHRLYTPRRLFNVFNAAPLPDDFDLAARDTLRGVEAALLENADDLQWVTFVPIDADVWAKNKAEYPLPDQNKIFWKLMLRVPLMIGSLWLYSQVLAFFSEDNTSGFKGQLGPVGTLIFFLTLAALFKFMAAAHYEFKKRMHSSHNAYRLRLNRRKRRIEWLNFLGSGVRQSKKFHSGAELPAFALPKHDDSTYHALREQVQAEVTRISGAHFREGEDTVSDFHLR